MKVNTAVGVLNITTDFYPFIHFVKQQQSLLPSLEDRELAINIETVDHVEVGVSDPPEAYPRTVYPWDKSKFTLWKDRIEGQVAKNLAMPGILVAWLWGGIPILLAPERWECLHASAVDTEAGVIIIAGSHGSGKTSVAVDLMASGASMFSDDRVLVNGQGVARAWSTLLHADPRTAQVLTGAHHALDGYGKAWIAPPSTSTRNEAPIAKVYNCGGEMPLRDDGPGWDSAWVNDYGIGENLLVSAPRPPSYRLEDNIRVALTNRNPWRGRWAWDGGDMTEIWGWIEGLKANRIHAEFVPEDELVEDEWDLIHVWNGQYPWAKQIATTTRKPLIVTAITQQEPIGVYPAAETMAPVVNRASVVLCYSTTERDFYQERFPDQAGKFRIMPQGVSASLYDYVDNFTKPTGKFVFQAGRYCERKNQLATLEACLGLDIPVVFAGPVDADYAYYLIKLREAAGNWKGVRFFGSLKGETLYQWFGSAHVHCQPSTWETCGVSTLEALAFGCNIVYTSNSFGAAVYEKHGSICEPTATATATALQYEMNQQRGRHRFRPPIWQMAVRVAIPWYREALGL